MNDLPHEAPVFVCEGGISSRVSLRRICQLEALMGRKGRRISLPLLLLRSLLPENAEKVSEGQQASARTHS